MKFSIRDLFLVTVIVALVLGWWVDRRQWLPSTLTEREAERLKIDNELLRRCIDRIDRELPEHGLQLEEFRYRQGMGRPHIVEVRVVPMPTSSASPPTPPIK